MITGGITVLMRPINFLASLVLLRLLNPEDFGTVALAMLLLTTTNIFSGLGMGPAVIQSVYSRRKVAFQSFVMTMIAATLFFLLIITNIPFFARLLGAPEIEPVLRWMSLSILIDNASTIPVSLMRKELQFGRDGTSTLASELAYTILSITLALMGFGLWSLVVARLSSSVVKTVLSWIMCPGWDWLRPTRWDREVSRSLLRYGVQTTAGGLINYFHTHWDDWLIGRVLGTTALGFYTKAYDLTNNTIRQFYRNVISVVFMPSYAKMQADPQRLERAYMKSMRFVLLLMVPMSLGILVIAPEMVLTLWEEKWMPMAPVLQIYAFMLLTRPISVNIAPLFQAVGKPILNSRAGVVLVAVMVPLALLLLPYGITGVALAVVISHVVGMLYNVWQLERMLPGTAVRTLKYSLPTLLAGVVMAGVVWLAKAPISDLFGRPDSVWGLLLLVAIGGIVYGGLIFLLQRDLILEILRMVSQGLGPKTRLARFLPKRTHSPVEQSG